jgi:hypothetical protein
MEGQHGAFRDAEELACEEQQNRTDNLNGCSEDHKGGHDSFVCKAAPAIASIRTQSTLGT